MVASGTWQDDHGWIEHPLYTRWISHKRKAIQHIVDCFGIYMRHSTSLSQDSLLKVETVLAYPVASKMVFCSNSPWLCFLHGSTQTTLHTQLGITRRRFGLCALKIHIEGRPLRDFSADNAVSLWWSECSMRAESANVFHSEQR